MGEATSVAAATSPRRPQGTAVSGWGPSLFAAAVAAIGAANLIFLRQTALLHSPPPVRGFLAYPNLPVQVALAGGFGLLLIILGAWLLLRGVSPGVALALGAVMLVCAAAVGLPRVWAFPGDMGLRTVLFQDLALGVLALLLPGRDAIAPALDRACRYALGAALFFFGLDHFLALAPIATLVPAWMPAHRFWVAFFGVAFIAAAIGIAFDYLLRWAAGLAAAMFALFVLSLHLPTALGWYGITRIPREPFNADDWTNVFLVLALCGGLWALARAPTAGTKRDCGRVARKRAASHAELRRAPV